MDQIADGFRWGALSDKTLPSATGNYAGDADRPGIDDILTDIDTNFGKTAEVVSVPASASATGTANQIAFDGSYLYVCIATDTWKCIAWSSWPA